MDSGIRLEPMAEEGMVQAPARGANALQPLPDPPCTLRFAISIPDPAGLEALRHARRSMLREEWTLGRDAAEASLESAVFSATEVAWTVLLSQRARCRERLAELEARANRAAQELRRT
jgi:hypothetical protein